MKLIPLLSISPTSGTYGGSNASTYAGEFQDGMARGEGVMKFENGTCYAGTFIDN